MVEFAFLFRANYFADSILRLNGSDLFEGAEITQPPPVEELLDLHR